MGTEKSHILNRRVFNCEFGLGTVKQEAYRINEPLNEIEWTCIEYCPFPMCKYHQSCEQEGFRRYYFGRAGIV